MTANAPTTANTTIDPAYIAEIVRRVLARVRANELRANDTHAGEPVTVAVSEIVKLVTVDTVLARAASSDRRITITRKSIVTPAARDEAKRLGVRLEFAGANAGKTSKSAAAASLGMIDTTAASWVESVIAGLARRGITATSGYAAKQIVLTDTPAKRTHHYSSSGKHRAVMLSELAQVERFHGELDPDVWVIDKKQMNLPTIVNAAATIARLSGVKT